MTYQSINATDLTTYLREFPENTQVRPAYAYAEQVRDYFHGNNVDRGQSLPWSKTHGKISIRPAEVSLWAGFNGAGKSLITGQALMGFNEPACIASMEMQPHLTVARMCRQASGVNLPSQEFINDFHEWLSGRLWMYTQQNSVKADRVLGLARYCGTGVVSEGKKIRMKHLVIDSLMKVGIGTDDYAKQKEFVNDLCSIAKDTGMHIHLVCHMRKGETEFKEPDKMDIKGASELSDQVDNVFILWRNKAKEDELAKSNPNEKITSGADVFLACRKQRHGEFEGKIALWFDKRSMQYVGSEGGRPIDFMSQKSEAA